jgi:DNA-directed RNA polymerase I and III subunit RPAC1
MPNGLPLVCTLVLLFRMRSYPFAGELATASYRILPHIVITSPIPPQLVRKFQSCFPEGVIEIRKNARGVDEAYVKDARKDTVTREVLRHEEFKDKVELKRIRDYFLCELCSILLLRMSDACPWTMPYKLR